MMSSADDVDAILGRELQEVFAEHHFLKVTEEDVVSLEVQFRGMVVFGELPVADAVVQVEHLLQKVTAYLQQLHTVDEIRCH